MDRWIDLLRESFLQNRIIQFHKFITDNYEVIEGCGKKGGGFIFDTHSIHRAGIDLKSGGGGGVEVNRNDNAQTRMTLIAEYHSVIKCYLNDEYDLGLPCPSGDQYIVNKILE